MPALARFFPVWQCVPTSGALLPRLLRRFPRGCGCVHCVNAMCCRRPAALPPTCACAADRVMASCVAVQEPRKREAPALARYSEAVHVMRAASAGDMPLPTMAGSTRALLELVSASVQPWNRAARRGVFSVAEPSSRGASADDEGSGGRHEEVADVGGSTPAVTAVCARHGGQRATVAGAAAAAM